MSSTLDIAKIALRISSPVGWLVAEGAEKAAQMVANASNNGVDQLKEEITKQTLQMQFAQQQARIAQELAIARRIDNAEEVEIEEFYDTSGKGNTGISIDQASQTASVGVGAEGRRVTKRVYHFKGWCQQDNEVITQILV
jgi:hypothetical protein